MSAKDAPWFSGCKDDVLDTCLCASASQSPSSLVFLCALVIFINLYWCVMPLGEETCKTGGLAREGNPPWWDPSLCGVSEVPRQLHGLCV